MDFLYITVLILCAVALPVLYWQERAQFKKRLKPGSIWRILVKLSTPWSRTRYIHFRVIDVKDGWVKWEYCNEEGKAIFGHDISPAERFKNYEYLGNNVNPKED